MRRSIQGPAQQFDLRKGAEIDIRLHIKFIIYFVILYLYLISSSLPVIFYFPSAKCRSSGGKGNSV